MELPVELVGLLSSLLVAGVTWLVVAGFKGLGEAFDKDFSVAAKAVAAVVSAAVVSAVFGVIDIGLAYVPEQFAPVVQSVLALLVTLFSAMGIQRQSKQ
ncbi:MAG: hypothetical protein GY706_02005 [Bacteroides sp.]|nr:hypothetical protein [Bacteroides sp.]MCP4140649.1 hypothetical protein [Chloroflexota bacterium]